MKHRLELTRAQILAFRTHANGLDARRPHDAKSLRAAAWAGLQDSMPRAALLSIHARVSGARPDTWEARSLVQVWGPRFSAYVVPERDRALFTVARVPDDPAIRKTFEQLADRIEASLDGSSMDCRELARGLGRTPNSLRYATLTGRLAIRWDGARQPTVWTMPRPTIDPFDARVEMARRYFHVFGPATPEGFAQWAGIKPPRARAAVEALAGQLTPVGTPVGDAWILSEDEKTFRATSRGARGARLLPSGDTSFLFWGADRELLVPDARLRSQLWTPRVWPGAMVIDGEVVGTWRRAGAVVSIQPWLRLPRATRDAVELEALSFPLPGVDGEISVRWDE